MHERLIENWLDSAGERSYQAPFCQLLAARGHTILHSTRHAPIELGKDILSRDEEGGYHAFQLKGNPGSRLTLSQYRDISGQLQELVTLPIDNLHGNVAWHRSYLVTNGSVDEEVRLAIERFNEGQKRQGQCGRLEIIQRGDILAWAKDAGHALWPSELEHTQSLLELLVMSGDEELPLMTLHQLLLPLLGLREDTDLLAKPELKRRIGSAGILVGVSLARFAERGNHWALVQGWTMFAAYCISASERHRSTSTVAGGAVDIAIMAIRDALEKLATEAQSAGRRLPADAAFEGYLWRGRVTLMAGLLSLLWLWRSRSAEDGEVSQAALSSTIDEMATDLQLWGEAAFPSHLMVYWYQRSCRVDPSTDQLLAKLGRLAVAGRNASPYADLSKVTRNALASHIPEFGDPYDVDKLPRASYFLESILHLLVRAGLKTECKGLWPQVTRTTLVEFDPEEKWRFSLWRAEKGVYRNVMVPHRKLWRDLLAEAADTRTEKIPEALAADPILLACFILVFPHRGTPACIRSLSAAFDKIDFSKKA